MKDTELYQSALQPSDLSLSPVWEDVPEDDADR